ncbi:MORN repeat-containing protein [Poritiphilus flavus]|uniref:MORN repeat-containing protein n=1 Tax=Poritiphilus flavus TaxID=2697053 RepID=A0A6L9EEX6_9FLAO|nr:hypothetical protein [Poritiphilus flavus]NAS13286.1 hypothetical protein [Poritiphilus flavus]
MRKQYFTYITAFFLLLTTGVAIYYQSKAKDLQNELEATKAHEIEMEGSIAAQHELLSVDSLLVDGNYRAALTAYEEQFKELQEDDSAGLQLRMALANQLMHLRASRNARLNQDSVPAQDSVQTDILSNARVVKQYDSINFVLEKTKVQLARTKKQLLKKSFGEYLTFKSSKGSQLHYVGEVKDHKANGHGLALLNTGSRYEGEWKDNMRHGEGTFFWADGERYEGNYVNDKRQGEGTYYWPNGEKYVGQWKNDQRYGKGIFFGKDGEIVANGVWKEDVLVQADK